MLMIRRNAVRVMAAMMVLLMTSGCSVIMALSGDPEPNFGVIQPGATRAMVEKELGTPFHTNQQSDQRTDWYRYELGNAPNGDRALANFALDVYSILLWELIATPRELMMGDDHEMSVVYGPEDRVIAVNRKGEETVPEPIHLGTTTPSAKEEPTVNQPTETPGNQPVPGGRPPSSR
ncbi:hypothetical protein [Nitrospina gracilis]|uniref:hypothetical protein n=1 Tax=Nitrospina gracilis TaxID=35801 RepID=UPI001F1E72AD|nr:hypothetical protein [Nitrospina gracilis]MCF8721071.1 uncharacterized protein YceK [Nitrospina gracilis Nb-211]